MLILKIVGYAEQIVTTTSWRTSRRTSGSPTSAIPTRGRVWHPGGAHPFCGLNEALVHNGDFANYYSVTEYLAQRNITPLFLTDTEVSILVFDLWNRVYKYPLEYIIEGLAPTTERDFDMLPKEKQEIYRQIQTRAHSRLAGRPVVLHHRAATTSRTTRSSCSASPTPRCSGRRSSRCRTARCRSA